MPELPEVETIRNYLRIGTDEQPAVLGKMICSAEVLWSRSIAFPSPNEFQNLISGQTILEIGRRGKYLIFYLSDNKLLVHLRMSGDLFLRSTDDPAAAHDRVVFHLENSGKLAFNDARKFGRMWLVEDLDQVIADLGPEPFQADLAENFYDRLQATRRQIKPLLLDQSFLAGLGNIYTDEALFLARIHPKTLSNQISLQSSLELLESIRQVLQEGIQSHGASIDWVYRGGDFQNHFRVYRQTGRPCVNCGTAIERIIIGQRSTHFCPTCQREG